MADRGCAVEGCDRPFSTRSGDADYCDAHYNRLRRYGDPLAGGTFRVRRSEDNPCIAEGCDNRAKARGMCIGHYSQWQKGQALRPLRQFNKVKDGKKRCPKCEQTLPLSQFGTKGNGQHQWLCKPCTAIYNRMQIYGLSYDEVKELLGRSCAGCGRVGMGKGFHIDHCHDTGAVRGLLCTNCNSALGLVHDDPAVLRRLADYIDAGLI